MKKIYSLLLLALFASGAFAQQATEITGMTAKTIYKPAFSTQKTTGVIDTLADDILARSTGFFLLTAGPNGYPTGTNGNCDESAMHFDNPGATAVVSELMVYFAHKEILGLEDTLLKAYAYDAGVDSMPTGAAIAEGTFRTNDIDTSGFPTFIMLNNGGTGLTTGDFLVSVVTNYTGNNSDTIVVLANNPTGDGGGENRLKQFVSGYGWLDARDFWSFGGAPMDGDALIFPIVDYVVGVEQPETFSNGMQFRGHYPNPAVDYVNLRYGVEFPQTISISVFDQQGRVIAHLDPTYRTAGDHESVVNVSNFPAGKYYYRVTSDTGAQWTSRFVVVK